jgi:dTDP-4-dehydrorhamnose reductase
VNGEAPGILAEEAERLDALLVHYSSAYVFDGASDRPYGEDDPPNPVNVYGRAKFAGEQAIAATGAAHVILRLSWIYSLRGANFLTAILERASQREELAVVDDQIGSPTWARPVAEATARILQQSLSARSRSGIFHLSAAGAVSRFRFAQAIIAAGSRLRSETRPWARVRPVASADYPLPARRPRYTVLAHRKIQAVFGIEMGEWQTQFDAFVATQSDNS